MTITTRPFDAAKYLTTPAAIAVYLDEVAASGDAAAIGEAIGVAARAKGMTDISRDAGVNRSTLYRTLSKDGNPELETVMKVLHALKLRIRIEADA